MLRPYRRFRYSTNMAFAEGLKCPSFHTQLLDHFECANSTQHFRQREHTLCIQNIKCLVQKECHLEHTTCFHLKYIHVYIYKKNMLNCYNTLCCGSH